MPSRKLALWLGVLLLFLPVLAGLALPVTGYGLLIRYDPMAVSETEPSFVQDVACIYAGGFGA